MIVFLEGKIIHQNESSVFLATESGVGYEIFVAHTVQEGLKKDDFVKLFTYMHVRENEMVLYGFKALDQRAFFIQLLSVKGVGPKIALEIISTSPQLLDEAFLRQDSSILTSIKGLGKKTAERLLLELKNSYQPLLREQAERKPDLRYEEAVEALIQLGYERSEAYEAFKTVPEDINTTEELIRWFLAYCDTRVK